MAVVMPTSRAPWVSAVAAYRAAEAALNSHPYCKAPPASASYDELALDHASFLLKQTTSLKTLLATPSPDAEALAEKLSIYCKEFGSDEELTVVIADARRFLLDARRNSPLAAMHRRYEQANAEYDVVEKAEREARDDKDESEADKLARAMKALTRETDALRVAMLHQVPDDWVEAMLLQFHIVAAYDMQASCEGKPDSELEALQTAIETLLDFMCCEVDQDHGEIGATFQREANRVFFKRRRRTGVVED